MNVSMNNAVNSAGIQAKEIVKTVSEKLPDGSKLVTNYFNDAPKFQHTLTADSVKLLNKGKPRMARLFEGAKEAFGSAKKALGGIAKGIIGKFKKAPKPDAELLEKAKTLASGSAQKIEVIKTCTPEALTDALKGAKKPAGGVVKNVLSSVKSFVKSLPEKLGKLPKLLKKAV